MLSSVCFVGKLLRSNNVEPPLRSEHVQVVHRTVGANLAVDIRKVGPLDHLAVLRHFSNEEV